MSRKKTSRQERPGLLTQRSPRVGVAVAVSFSLVAAWTMLAYSGALDSAFRQKGGNKRAVSIASLNSNSPSKELIYAGGRLIATEEPCISDTQPPDFPNGCPAISVAAAFQCPFATSAQVNFANPVATDNCAVGSVSCNPPSGSSFPVGTSSVTCAATDTSNNTATCSFTVSVFSGCLVDDSNSGNVVLFNASTGDYRFCCNGVVSATGRGTLTVSGCNVTIHNVKGDRTVDISVAGTGSGSGSASIQKPGPVVICQINDTTMTGNACTCP
jgi:hypothetical protein